jgi:flagellar basal-body rod protein FlgC
VSLFSNCLTGRFIDSTGSKEIKIAIYNGREWEFLTNLFIYKGHEVEPIFERNFLTIKNVNEYVVMDILMVLKIRQDIIANNIANVQTTRTVDGGIFRRQYLNISAENGIEIITDTLTETRFVYDPTHPDSILSGRMAGYVEMPNVDIVNEMVDMIAVNRLFEQILEYAKRNFKKFIW